MRGWRLFAVAALAGVVASASGTGAEAKRGKHRRVAQAARSVYSPPYAAMVVDANTGRAMYAVSEDELRHPASITKVMTLYLLFEQLDRGKLALDTELKVSRHGASMSPSKLGLRPGETIDVEDAIKALVTKSANDVAATIAENLAGSEEAFAERMTRKARQLGMRRTVYRNASGLPDREQVTTARDLTILARAIQERFPKYYRYFQTRSFEYAGQTIGNHNRLLGRVEGVDGIKTGFTNASGFNLMTSARLDGRHVVGVVLGGRSGASRDNIMAGLIRQNLAKATTGGKASVLASLEESDDDETSAPTTAPARAKLASAVDVETTASLPSAPARKPIEAARPAGTAAALPSAFTGAKSQATLAGALSYAPTETQRAAASPPPGQKIDARLPFAPATPTGPVRAEIPVAKPVVVAARPAPAPEPPREVTERNTTTTPWVIQLAAEGDEDKARSLLDQAKSSSRILARAAPFTEKIVRGGSTLYRARFSGFAEADSAQEACKALKSKGFNCFATRS